jgi:lipid II:glycine glycyltransferase (peptidoglycan interpeptide bridge formation enzyme)
MEPLASSTITDNQGNSWFIQILPRKLDSTLVSLDSQKVMGPNLKEPLPDPIEPSFFQSSYWGRVKSKFGWRSFEFVLSLQRQDQNFDQISQSDSIQAVGVNTWLVLVLVKTLAPGILLAYIPHGPDSSPLDQWFTKKDQEELVVRYLKILGDQLSALLPKSVIALRFDPPWGRPISKGIEDSAEAFVQDQSQWNLQPLTKGHIDIQPPVTGIIDLTQDLDELLGSFKSKHRYNIRLAEKKGVEITSFQSGEMQFDEQLIRWYGLYEETAKRDGILIHSLGYYRQVTQLFPEVQHSEPGKHRKMVLFQAHHQGDYLAGILVIFWNNRATYLYGASGNEKRNLMPAYGLQWAAIQEAKGLGCNTYDLFGMPGSPDPNHPMAGLYQFKAGFIQHLVRYPGTWDLVTHPVLYKLYTLAEALRLRIIKLKKSLR